MDYSKVKGVIVVNTNSLRTSCDICEEKLSNGDSFDYEVNHFLKKHKLKLLHIGQETVWGDNGLWQCTVAVFQDKTK